MVGVHKYVLNQYRSRENNIFAIAVGYLFLRLRELRLNVKWGNHYSWINHEPHFQMTISPSGDFSAPAKTATCDSGRIARN